MVVRLQQNFEKAASILRERQDDELVLFVLRHGESLGQKNPQAYEALGDDALPITRQGVMQSVAAGKLLSQLCLLSGFTELEIRTSSGERSGTTAWLISEIMDTTQLRITLREDRRLDKQKFGAFDGHFTTSARKLHAPDAFQEYEQHEKPKGEFHARPPGGESIADVQARTAQVLKEVIARPVPTAFVTHGTNGLCVENFLMNRGEEWVLASQDQRLNCSIHMLSGKLGAMRHIAVADDPLGWSRNNLNWSLN